MMAISKFYVCSYFLDSIIPTCVTSYFGSSIDSIDKYNQVRPVVSWLLCKLPHPHHGGMVV